MKTHRWVIVILTTVILMAVILMAAILSTGCSLTANPSSQTERLSSTVAALESNQAQQLEWLSYQATQIGENRLLIATLQADQASSPPPVPAGPTQSTSHGIGGSVTIEKGSCCVGSTAGETIKVAVQFEATSPNMEGIEMRVVPGVREVNPGDMVNVPWEAFTPEKEYEVFVPINWTTFWVHVQYRDASGGFSVIYSDEIAVEGMPPQPTETPNQ